MGSKQTFLNASPKTHTPPRTHSSWQKYPGVSAERREGQSPYFFRPCNQRNKKNKTTKATIQNNKSIALPPVQHDLARKARFPNRITQTTPTAKYPLDAVLEWQSGL